MTGDELYTFAEQEGIAVCACPLPETRSLSMPLGERCYIGIDTGPMTRSEENLLLGHELGHCCYAGFYSRNAPYEVRERIEHKADAWQICRQVPLEELRAALREGRCDLWELAERFDLPEENIKKAIYYYKENLGVRF